jgi:hypothetical protein
MDLSEAREGSHKKAGAAGRLPAATLLVELGSAAELWHTPDHRPFAAIRTDDEIQNLPIRGGGFRRWLSRRFYGERGTAPKGGVLADALAVLEGIALNDGEMHEAYVRLGRSADGRIFLDLASRDGAIEITKDAWRVVPSSEVPICFIHPPGMLPLPTPSASGSIEELRRLLNVHSDDDFKLVIGWLLGGLCPTGPYPLLGLHGEQGTAKTTAARMLRALLDPNAAPVRAEPRDTRDLLIAARNSWVIALDNLSRIPTWLSDALCRLSTGGGFATRTLYTDDEETIFEAQRPVLLNGISELATRDDLLDRSIVLTLSPIPNEARRCETDLWREFEEARPGILGALLSGVVAALKNEDAVRLEQTPRMADFATWLTAAEPGLGWDEEDFLRAYVGNRGSANEVVLEASPVAAAILQLVHGGSPWSGTATELLDALDCITGEQIRRMPDWPKTARALSMALQRLAPNLRATGVNVTRVQTAGRGSKRLIQLEKLRDSFDACDASDAGGPGTTQVAGSASQTVPESGQSAAGVAGVARPDRPDEADYT